VLKKIPALDLTTVSAPDRAHEPPRATSARTMPEPVEVPRELRSMGEPARTSVFRHPDGQAAFAVMRWERGKKLTLPVCYDGERFISKGYDYPKPLYNSDIIAAHPDWPVLIVEGEKAAEDGAAHLPEGWCITTWAGGTEATGKSDWSILKGRRCVIWPDNDDAGHAAAAKIEAILGATAAVVRLSKAYPAKWDLADPLPQGITPGMVSANIMSTFERTKPPAPTPVVSVLPAPEPEPLPEPEEDGFIDEDLSWRALGYDDSHYYIMPASTGIVKKLSARELMSAPGCLQVVNDMYYWGEQAPSKSGPDWTQCGSMLMRACENAGYYDERRLRGRGVWMDDDRVVVNTGDAVIVDGRAMSPAKVKSRHIYKRAEALFVDAPSKIPEATDAEGRLIVELCNAPRWDKPVHGDLLAGYIATSMVCGALHWRTHIWVTGNAGSGKSTVMSVIAAACIGDVGVYPLGPTTEAGIRQFIGSDARPVIFDEMEGMEQQQSDARRQAIISLMRMASSTGRGRIMKGSAGHKATSFTMQSSFLVASIGMSLKEAPDLTRTLVLSLRPIPSDATTEQRAEADERFAALNRLAARLPVDIPNRLFARQARLVNVIRKNAETFREVIADILGNRRLGDQVGTLLAGRFSLTSEKILTKKECEDYVNRFQWRDVVATPADREDRQLVNHMKQVVVRVIDNFGKPVDRTVGELVDLAFGNAVDDTMDAGKVAVAITRFGLLVDRMKNGIWLSSRNEELNKLMRSSTNPIDWYSVVARNPMAERSEVPIRFAGASTPAVFLPKGEWYA